MQVLSTNIAQIRTIEINGISHQTGIYKKPVSEGIFLERMDVKNDQVIDRKYHGGTDKACYLYAADHYSYWREKYPMPDWSWGMFGENLTIHGMDESQIHIGDEYLIGTALVQVSQPRQPCFKLGVRLGNQEAVNEFWLSSFPGVYVRVLIEGEVKAGDFLIPKKINENAPSITEVFSLFSNRKEDVALYNKVIADHLLAESCRNDLIRKQNRLQS